MDNNFELTIPLGSDYITLSGGGGGGERVKKGGYRIRGEGLEKAA